MQIQVYENHLPKLCVVTTRENEMHIYSKNLQIWAKVTQVSNVAHGHLV
jgi:hypothetical protein